MKRRSYRVNADSFTVLEDILVSIPEEFNSDSTHLRGRTIREVTSRPFAHIKVGRLPEEFASDFEDAIATGFMEYVIYSYDTPIAWRERTISPNRVKGSNGHTVGYSHYRWVMPDVRYSVTTSKHQGKVRTALSQISGGID